jgi:hypothetical protein
MEVETVLLGRFVEELLLAQSFEARFKAFEKLAGQLKFDSLTYTFLPHFELAPVAENKPPLFIKSNSFPDSFIDQHINDGLFKDDFTIRKIGKGDYCPLDWKDSERSGELSENEEKIIKIAREDHCIENAFTIPLMPQATRTLGISGVSVVSDENDRLFDMLKANVKTMVLAAQLFHQTCFVNLDVHRQFIWRYFDQLTPKERQLLRSLIQGRKVKQIAGDFGMADKSVYRIFDGIRQKSGGISSLHELIYIATLAQIIETS